METHRTFDQLLCKQSASPFNINVYIIHEHRYTMYRCILIVFHGFLLAHILELSRPLALYSCKVPLLCWAFGLLGSSGTDLKMSHLGVPGNFDGICMSWLHGASFQIFGAPRSLFKIIPDPEWVRSMSQQLSLANFLHLISANNINSISELVAFLQA